MQLLMVIFMQLKKFKRVVVQLLIWVVLVILEVSEVLLRLERLLKMVRLQVLNPPIQINCNKNGGRITYFLPPPKLKVET